MARTDDIVVAPSESADFRAGDLAAANRDDPRDASPFGAATVTDSGFPSVFATLDFAANQRDIPFHAEAYALRGNESWRAPWDIEKPGVSLQNPEANALGRKFTVNNLVFYRDANNALQVGTVELDVEPLDGGRAPAPLRRFEFQDSSPSELGGLLLLCVAFLGVGVATLPRHHHRWIA
jgi:hypothetical protein